ncbi:hypothetical protein FA95DRAFT_981415 [Auriscalpium vulgare]|uniref:Uncharacterized protein n=1 Tax=Auriscalpium vulgare TaxID=40419 RepID=A0ACB8R7G0_9AGAM|nr:hypothetical protein FA95DRAFT_981415 [Auriscalpium vulgare]
MTTEPLATQRRESLRLYADNALRRLSLGLSAVGEDVWLHASVPRSYPLSWMTWRISSSRRASVTALCAVIVDRCTYELHSERENGMQRVVIAVRSTVNATIPRDALVVISTILVYLKSAPPLRLRRATVGERSLKQGTSRQDPRVRKQTRSSV